MLQQQVQVLHVFAYALHGYGVYAVAVAIDDGAVHLFREILCDCAHAVKGLFLGADLGYVQAQKHFANGGLFQVFGECGLGVKFQTEQGGHARMG